MYNYFKFAIVNEECSESAVLISFSVIMLIHSTVTLCFCQQMVEHQHHLKIFQVIYCFYLIDKMYSYFKISVKMLCYFGESELGYFCLIKCKKKKKEATKQFIVNAASTIAMFRANFFRVIVSLYDDISAGLSQHVRL